MSSLRGCTTTPLALVVFSVVGCAKSDHPPTYHKELDAPIDAGLILSMDGGTDQAPPEDMTNICGTQVLPLAPTRTNLYIVLDRSGSMGPNGDWMLDPSSGRTVTKHSAALNAIVDVLYAMGHRVNYGAADFPHAGDIEGCSPGGEVDHVAPGDSVTYVRSGIRGPHLTKLKNALDRTVPEGNTPTSATLAQLIEPLSQLSGSTSVVLATDGAPNCNAATVCDSEHCIPNIEHAMLTNGLLCDDTLNCCGPRVVNGPLGCVDVDASVAKIAELLRLNIHTYVIGLPGTEAYQDTLNRMATAGGTARVQTAATDPLYYSVTDTAQLTTALAGITAAISISCTITLDQVPPDWSKVNVYFDNGLIHASPNDGWIQVDAQTLELVGPSCDLLHTGNVFEVQVVAGCPTEREILI